MNTNNNTDVNVNTNDSINTNIDMNSNDKINTNNNRNIEISVLNIISHYSKCYCITFKQNVSRNEAIDQLIYIHKQTLSVCRDTCCEIL